MWFGEKNWVQAMMPMRKPVEVKFWEFNRVTHGEGGREQLAGGYLGIEVRGEHEGSGSLSMRPEVTW